MARTSTAKRTTRRLPHSAGAGLPAASATYDASVKSLGYFVLACAATLNRSAAAVDGIDFDGEAVAASQLLRSVESLRVLNDRVAIKVFSFGPMPARARAASRTGLCTNSVTASAMPSVAASPGSAINGVGA